MSTIKAQAILLNIDRDREMVGIGGVVFFEDNTVCVGATLGTLPLAPVNKLMQTAHDAGVTLEQIGFSGDREVVALAWGVIDWQLHWDHIVHAMAISMTAAQLDMDTSEIIDILSGEAEDD